MSNFVANVRVKLHDEELKTLQNLKTQTVNVKVNLTGDGSNFIKEFSTHMNSMSSTALKSGRQVATMFNRGIKSIDKNSFYKEHFAEQKKMVAESQKLSKQYNVSEKNAMKAITARKRAESNYAKEIQKRVSLEKKVEERWLKNLHTQEQAQKKAQQMQLQQQKEMASSYVKTFASGKYNADYTVYNEKLAKYDGQESNSLKNARSYLSQYKSIMNELNSSFNGKGFTGMNDDQIVAKFQNAEAALNKYKNAMREVAATISKPFNTLDAVTASNKTLMWLKNNSKAAKEYGVALQDIAAKQRNATSTKELATYNKEFKNVVSQAQVAGKTGRTFFGEIGRGFKQIGQFVGTYGVYMKAVQTIKQMAGAVKDVDDAMTELYKVSDAPIGQIKNYFSEASESAKEFGRTISEVINSTADWSRLGYNLQDSKELARITSLYQNVGDNITQESASQSLTSTLQGFQLDASEAESIIDKFNEVANNYAIDSAGIGEALRRSAASFNAANTDLSKSIALITGTNEVVQDPDVVGNMWKTVSMRIRSTKQELENAGEDTDGMVESTAQLRDLVQGLTGFDIMADKAGTQFKDIYDIAVGIGEEWHNLTDVEQAGLLETLAGKRQGNSLAAALNNIDTIKEVYNTAEFESAGSAMRENEKYMDSLSGHIGVFKAQFQELSNVTLDSDFLKAAVDAGTGLLNILTKIIDVGGGIPAIFGTIGTIKIFKNLD